MPSAGSTMCVPRSSRNIEECFASSLPVSRSMPSSSTRRRARRRSPTSPDRCVTNENCRRGATSCTPSRRPSMPRPRSLSSAAPPAGSACARGRRTSMALPARTPRSGCGSPAAARTKRSTPACSTTWSAEASPQACASTKRSSRRPGRKRGYRPASRGARPRRAAYSTGRCGWSATRNDLRARSRTGAGFRPANQDGEAHDHRLVDLAQAAQLIAVTDGGDEVTVDASLVVLDFLFRHAAIAPDAPHYVALEAWRFAGADR